MSKSMKRVKAAIAAAGIEAEVVILPDGARTAADAARSCDCAVGQIAKSMIFEGEESGALKLLLVSGAHDVDLTQAKALFGEPLKRADAKRVRAETGFAIGGVAPLGHLTQVETWMDRTLMQYDAVWGAAGTPHSVFRVSPEELLRATGATLFEMR